MPSVSVCPVAHTTPRSPTTTSPRRSPGRPVPPPPFSIDLLLPALWNSNPARASQGLPSPELTPGARLGWTRLLDAQPIRLSAVADLSADRFAHMRPADADLLYGRLRAEYELDDIDALLDDVLARVGS